MKKKTSAREVGLFVFLGILVIGLCYYKFLYQPLSEKISAMETECSSEQSLVDQYTISALKMDQMQGVVDEVKGSEQGNPIPEYNNSTELMKELYSILSMAEQYTLSFGSVSHNDGSYIVDRPVSVSLQAKNYDVARSILDSVKDSRFVNQISSIQMDLPSYNDGETTWTVFDYWGETWDAWENVSVSFEVTFYEKQE